MKTLKELKFTAQQANWVLEQVSNFQGIVSDENTARNLSAEFAQKAGLNNFNVKVVSVWNGLTGTESKSGFTVGYFDNSECDPIFKNGVEPIMIDDEYQGLVRI